MSRSFCFTLNNYTETDTLEISEVCANEEKMRYLIYGKEVGERGTKHLQGYMELKSPCKITTIKKLGLCFGQMHLETRRGSRNQARDYCKKSDQNPFEFGDWDSGGQGSRTDLKKLKTFIDNNPSVEAVYDAGYTRELLYYPRGIQTLIEISEKKKTREFRKLDVEVIYGAAGAGKTRSVTEKEKDLFIAQVDKGGFHFNGYDGERAILIDDFEGWIQYTDLLRILDGHQYRVNIKGAHRYAQWTKVYITSNHSPEKWYKTGLTPALKRRINRVTKLGDEEPGVILDPGYLPFENSCELYDSPHLGPATCGAALGEGLRVSPLGPAATGYRPCARGS